ncbi:MAG: hypothetical protein ACRDWA_00510 [Acidimicrobiia bacterium]
MTSNETDSRLLDDLAEAFAAADPMPDHVFVAAKEAIFWRTIDAELAELVFDSSAETLSTVRGPRAARQVTFRSPGIEIEIMLTADGQRRLVGQLVPPQEAEVELRFDHETRTASTDRLGRFFFDNLQVGQIQLRIHPVAGTLVVTDWLSVS